MFPLANHPTPWFQASASISSSILTRVLPEQTHLSARAQQKEKYYEEKYLAVGFHAGPALFGFR